MSETDRQLIKEHISSNETRLLTIHVEHRAQAGSSEVRHEHEGKGHEEEYYTGQRRATEASYIGSFSNDINSQLVWSDPNVSEQFQDCLFQQ